MKTWLPPMRVGMESFLKQFAGQEVLYHPNPGNGGDCLIAHGTYEAFRRASIWIKLIDLKDDVTGKTVFLGGGGNFIPIYHSIEAAFTIFFGKAARIVLLPHTIRGNEKLLSKLDESCTIFCRDAESYLHTTQVNERSEIYLEHDMAFHIDAADLLANQEHRANYAGKVKEKLAGHGLNLAAKPRVRFLRQDLESARNTTSTDMDMSIDYSFGTLPASSLMGSWCMLETISQAQFVETDRLHIGIGCALVEKPAILFDNSYGKNAAIYRHSLRNRTPYIAFQEFDAGDRGERHAPIEKVTGLSNYDRL